MWLVEGNTIIFLVPRMSYQLAQQSKEKPSRFDNGAFQASVLRFAY